MSKPPQKTVHHLLVYVPEAARGETLTNREVESRNKSIFALRYFAERKKFLAPMGVSINVMKIRKTDLQSKAVLQGFAKKNVRGLPALITPKNTYCDAGAIIRLYDSQIERFQLEARQKEAEIGGLHRETEAEEYYSRLMTFERAAADDKGEEDPFEDGASADGIMSRVDEMMKKRQAAQDRLKGGRKIEGGVVRPAVKPPADKKKGNVQASSIDSLIQQVGSKEVSFDDVFGGGAADSTDERSRSGDARDNLIERAFLENMEDSSML